MAKNSMIYVGVDANHLTPIHPDPAGLTWGLQDISSANAGRTQEGVMNKMLVSKKRKLQLKWTLTDETQASAILQAFDHEYFYCKYWDVLAGDWQVREFYAGDKSAPFQWFQLDNKGTKIATVSFDIIER